VIASSTIPFFGYFAISIGRPFLLAFFTGFRKGKENVELTSLARKENSMIHKVVVKNMSRPPAYANHFTNSIILSSKIVEILTDLEIKAVVYHEVGHGGFFPLFKRVLGTIFLIPVFLLLYIIVCTFVYGITKLFQPFVNTLCLALLSSFLFCLFFLFAERENWKGEYKADAYSADKVGASAMISALKKITQPEFANCDFPTHPSLKRRIAFLEARAPTAC